MGLLSGGLSLGGGSLGSFGKLGMLPSLGSMGSFGRSMGMSNGNGGQLGGQRMSEGDLLQLSYRSSHMTHCTRLTDSQVLHMHPSSWQSLLHIE